MLPVVVGTNPSRTEWLNDCLNSIVTTCDWPIWVHHDGGYEPTALREACGRFDRFLFLQDSVTILAPEFWTHIHEPAWLAGWPPMYLAVYDSAELAPHLPKGTVTKEHSIQLEAQLPTLLNMPTLWPNIRDANALRTEYRHGRDNLILGNHLFEKAKGTWR